MSYILDALTKSEQERRGTRIEVLETEDGAPVALAGRRMALLAVLLLLLLVTVAASAWYFRGAFLEAPDSRVEEVGQQDGGSSPAATAAPVVIDSTRILSPASSEGRASVSEVVSPTAEQESAAGSRSGDPSASGDRSAVATGGMAEALPPMVISVLSYSADPSRRFVMINGRFAREGETLDGGVVLERIEADRVELSRGKTRFLVEPR